MRLRNPIILLGILGVLLAALMIGAMLLFWPVEAALEHELRIDIFVALLFVGVLVYFAAVRLVMRHPLPSGGFWVVLAVAAVMRAVLLPAPPILSSDIYRYVWDGRVQVAGISPYRYLPTDPALASLRDADVYPFIGRKEYARTIYPPAAQLVFAAVGLLKGGVLFMKATMLAFEALGMACMVAVLRIAGLPRERLLIYAWNPLALWAFACDGHVDALGIGFLGLSLLLGVKGYERLKGVSLAAAALAKFIPIATAPAFVQSGRLWRPVLAGFATIALLYGFYAAAGTDVLGYLPGYGSEEGLDTGNGFWLLAGLAHLVAVPRWATLAYMATVMALYAGISINIMRRNASSLSVDPLKVCGDCAVLAAFATSAISPHYAWYFPWIALPCVVSPLPAAIWLASSSVLLYVDPFHDRFFWPSLVYIPAIALARLSSTSRKLEHGGIGDTLT